PEPGLRIRGRVAPAARLALVRAADEGERRPQQYLQVDEWRPVLDVPDIELDSFVPGQARAAVDLRPAGQAGLDLQPAALARRVALDLVGERGPRPDHAHVAADDVPELRQLVDRQPAQEHTRPRDAGVAFVDRGARTDALGADDHRPELEQFEADAVLADALLAVGHPPAVG